MSIMTVNSFADPSMSDDQSAAWTKYLAFFSWNLGISSDRCHKDWYIQSVGSEFAIAVYKFLDVAGPVPRNLGRMSLAECPILLP